MESEYGPNDLGQNGLSQNGLAKMAKDIYIYIYIYIYAIGSIMECKRNVGCTHTRVCRHHANYTQLRFIISAEEGTSGHVHTSGTKLHMGFKQRRQPRTEWCLQFKALANWAVDVATGINMD